MVGSRILLVGVGHALPDGTTVADCEAALADAAPDRSITVADAIADATLDAGVDCVVIGPPFDDDTVAFLDRVRTETDASVVGLLAPGTEQVPAATLTGGVTEWVRPADHADPVEALCAALPDPAHASDAGADSNLAPFDTAVDHYRQLVEHLADPVYLLDPAGYIEMVNEALIEKGDYEREEIVGSHVSRVMPEKDIAKGAEIIAELLADPERRSETVELEIIHDDGTRREYEDHISVVTDEDGHLAGTVGIVRDIQGRKERERELQQYETIVETVPEGVFVLDENANILAANEQCTSILGISRERGMASSIPELVAEGRIDEEVIPGYKEVVRDLLSSDSDADHGTYRYTVYPNLDDEARIIEARIALRPFDESFRGTIGVIQDVTEREQRIEELERYETIMQAVPDSVYATDGEGNIAFLNDAARERFGYSDADVASRSVHFTDVIDDDDVESFYEANRRLLSDEYETGDKAVIRYTAVTKDGRRFPAENHYSLMDTDGGRVAGAGITRDISDLQQREQRLQVLDRVLRHNLRNDLNAVIGNAELLERRFRGEYGDEYGVEIARSVRNQCDRLVEMSREIRAIQHALERDRMDRPELDAASLVERVVEPFRSAEPDVTIDLAIPERARVEADEALELAVSNLVENAIEHNDRSAPEIEVGIRERDTDRGEWYELYVADDGPGIPESERVALETNTEVTPLQHGTGIGLWAVAWIVGSFDGTVEIADREPRGTVVTLALRRAD